MIDLRQGDCLELMKDIPDKSIDMILTDLPYGTTNCRWDTIIDLDELWLQYGRIIKDNGAILLFAQPPFDKVLAVSNLKLFRYEWIWDKSQPTGHLNAKRMPLKRHENILVFYKKLPTYNPQMTTGHKRKKVSSKARRECEERNWESDSIYQKGNLSLINDYDSTVRYPVDIIKFSKDTQTSSMHPTQKPAALLEYLIKTYTNENEVVLDNCMGSGSTGVACINTNRNFIGMELDKDYFNIAKERIEGLKK